MAATNPGDGSRAYRPYLESRRTTFVSHPSSQGLKPVSRLRGTAPKNKGLVKGLLRLLDTVIDVFAVGHFVPLDGVLFADFVAVSGKGGIPDAIGINNAGELPLSPLGLSFFNGAHSLYSDELMPVGIAGYVRFWRRRLYEAVRVLVHQRRHFQAEPAKFEA